MLPWFKKPIIKEKVMEEGRDEFERKDNRRVKELYGDRTDNYLKALEVVREKGIYR